MGIFNYNFDLDDELNINEITYVVQGFIEFKDCDGLEWEEYKLKSKKTSEILWLSVDKSIDGYVLYKQSYSKNEFLENKILANGFKKFEECRASVVNYSGKVDVDLGDRVFLKEYCDDKFKHIVSIEEWEDEIEYSKGTVYSKEKVIKKHKESKKQKKSTKKTESKELRNILIVIVLAFITVLVYELITAHLDNRSISDILNSNSDFSYVTSVTSDLDNSKKADVFFSDKSIEDASKLIIEKTDGKVGDVQENTEDDSVVFSYKDEIALVYKGEDSKTLIQVSNRDYIFCSRVALYNGNEIENTFLRNYYMSIYYEKDRVKFNNLPNARQSAEPANFIRNNSNKYKGYTENVREESSGFRLPFSIRQESSGSRSSSGGGTSSGK